MLSPGGGCPSDLLSANMQAFQIVNGHGTLPDAWVFRLSPVGTVLGASLLGEGGDAPFRLVARLHVVECQGGLHHEPRGRGEGLLYTPKEATFDPPPGWVTLHSRTAGAYTVALSYREI